jgi:hypothetical protein
MAAELKRVSMLQADTPEWRLWAAVAELASYLTADQWVLIGGQMVALHLRLSGALPTRTPPILTSLPTSLPFTTHTPPARPLRAR